MSHQHPMPLTAAWNFDEFSFERNGVVDYDYANKEQQDALDAYLKEHYNAEIFFYNGPFLVIECEDDPAEQDHPFSIGGMVAIWRKKGALEGIGELPAYIGQAEEGRIPDKVRNMFDGCKIPPDDAILYLASTLFPDCEAITVIAVTAEMIIEFPEEDAVTYGDRLDAMPTRIFGMPFTLLYHNGPLPRTERATHTHRRTNSQPSALDAECEFVWDKTNYIESKGEFFPGTMIASIHENMKREWESRFATAGVLVQRDHQERLLCSYHLWANQVKDHPSLFGANNDTAQHVFKLLQGDPSTEVGFLRSRMGTTDLALVQLHSHTKFTNILLDTDSNLNRLVHSHEQRPSDRYVFNSYVTGQQNLLHAGQRFKLGARFSRGKHSTLPVPKGLKKEWPKDIFAYLAFKQLVCATNEPFLTRTPFVRGGMCGSVLVRVYDAARDRNSIKETEEEVRDRGECCGMMHFADMQSPRGPGSLGDYFLFADTFDPLIDAGWQMVPVPEHAAQSLGEVREAVPPPSAKRQKVSGSKSREVKGEEEVEPPTGRYNLRTRKNEATVDVKGKGLA